MKSREARSTNGPLRRLQLVPPTPQATMYGEVGFTRLHEATVNYTYTCHRGEKKKKKKKKKRVLFFNENEVVIWCYALGMTTRDIPFLHCLHVGILSMANRSRIRIVTGKRKMYRLDKKTGLSLSRRHAGQITIPYIVVVGRYTIIISAPNTHTVGRIRVARSAVMMMMRAFCCLSHTSVLRQSAKCNATLPRFYVCTWPVHLWVFAVHLR